MKKIIILILFSSLFALSYKDVCKVYPEKIDGFKKTQKCQGFDFLSNNTKAVKAMVLYEKGDKSISIMFLSGEAAQSVSTIPQYSFENNFMKIISTNCKGYNCIVRYMKIQNSGDIFILIKKGSNPEILDLTFNNMDYKEALRLVDYIDLKKFEF